MPGHLPAAVCPQSTPVDVIFLSGQGKKTRSTWGENGPECRGQHELTRILGGWRQMKANKMRWPTFGRTFINHPKFKKE